MSESLMGRIRMDWIFENSLSIPNFFSFSFFVSGLEGVEALKIQIRERGLMIWNRKEEIMRERWRSLTSSKYFFEKGLQSYLSALDQPLTASKGRKSQSRHATKFILSFKAKELQVWAALSLWELESCTSNGSVGETFCLGRIKVYENWKSLFGALHLGRRLSHGLLTTGNLAYLILGATLYLRLVFSRKKDWNREKRDWRYQIRSHWV